MSQIPATADANAPHKVKIQGASLQRAFRDLIWPRRWPLLAGLALILINRVAGLVLPGSTKYLIDDVVQKGNLNLLWTLAFAVGGAILVQALSSFSLTHLLSKAAQRLITEMRIKVQQHVGRLPVRYYDANKSGVLVSRIMTDVEGVRNLVGTGFMELIGGLLTAGLAFILLMRINATLTLLSIAFFALFGVILQRAFAVIRPIYRERGRLHAEISGRLTESLGGVRVVKGFHAEAREANVFAAGVFRIFENVRKTLTATSLIGLASTILMGVVSVTVMIVGGRMIVQGSMTLGEFFSYTLLMGFMIAPVFQAVNIGSQLTEAFAGLDRVHEVLSEVPEDVDPERVLRLENLEGHIRFQGVSFEYDPEKPVLQDVTFEARPGTVTALVGPSGSGKSSLIGLVAAFAKPTAGLIQVDGQDLSRTRLDAYRAHLGVVLQDNFLFDGTIRENILFGKPDATMQDVEQAAAVARVDEFALRFETGYETVIGERGVKLSGGQRQRVAIARAILANPRILILDEATSNLDTESEMLIQQGLAVLMRGRTTFVIAHRLSTIRTADQILVLEQGRVLERGRHEELLALGGRYHELYTRQYGVEANRFVNPGEGDVEAAPEEEKPAAEDEVPKLRRSLFPPALALILAFLLGVMSPNGLRGQDHPLSDSWRWIPFTVEDGLPSRRVLDVQERADGTVWALTDAGAAWYDGFAWRVAAGLQGHSGAPADSLCIDSSGDVLVVQDGRLYRGNEQGFRQLTVRERGVELAVSEAVPLPASAILLRAGNQLYELANGELKAFATPPGGLAPRGRALRWAHSRRIWLSSSDGLYSLEDRLWTQKLPYTQAWYQLGAVAENRSGMGLALVQSPAAARGLHVWSRVGSPQFLEPEPTLPMAADVGPAGEAIVLFRSGEVRWRGDGQWSSLASVPAGMENAYLLRFRSNGDLWIGNSQGFYLVKLSSRRWSYWHIPGDPFRSSVNEILRSRDGSFWIATGNGLDRRRPGAEPEWFQSIGGRRLGTVTGLAEDNEGNLWIGSGDSFPGSFRWDGREWKHFGAAEGLLAPGVHKIRRDRKGRLWFLGLARSFLAARSTEREPGAFVYEAGRFVRWDTDHGLPNGRVYAFSESPDGALWFGTNGGIARWKANEWRYWNVSNGLRGDSIFTLTTDDQGRVWFGDRVNGLGCIERDQVRYFTTADGLISDEVWDLQLDARGRLWITTQNGLAGYRDGIWTELGTATGLHNPHLWPVLPLEGMVCVGSAEGVAVLSLDEAGLPPPRLELEQPLVEEKRVLLRWRAFPYWAETAAASVETRYALDGNAWSGWETRRERVYLDLAPGEHVFQVQSKGLFGNPNPDAGRVAFVVPRAVYRRPEVLIPIGVLSLALLLVGAQLGFRKRRQERFLRESENRYRELFADAQSRIRALEAACEQEKNTRHRLESLLLQGLLTQEPFRPIDLDLSQLVGEMKPLLQAAVPKKIFLRCEPSEEPLPVHADPVQIRQLLLNLLSNGIEAIEGDHGVVAIRTGRMRVNRSQPNSIDSGLDVLAGECAFVEVTDTGKGMSEEIRRQIFDPFFSTKPAGLGLGLPAVLGIVRIHRGGMQVESMPGQGAAVRVFLPLKEAMSGAGAEGNPEVQ